MTEFTPIFPKTNEVLSLKCGDIWISVAVSKRQTWEYWEDTYHNYVVRRENVKLCLSKEKFTEIFGEEVKP